MKYKLKKDLSITGRIEEIFLRIERISPKELQSNIEYKDNLNQEGECKVRRNAMGLEIGYDITN